MFKTFVILAVAAAIIGMLLQGCFIAVEHKEKYIPAVVLKGSASVMFVTVGVLAYILLKNRQGFAAGVTEENISFACKIVSGLIFGLLGDVFLNLRFVFEKIGQKIFLVGIFFFLVGHILYLVALVPRSANFLVCAAIGAVLAAGLLIYIFKTMEVKLAFKIFGIVYLGAVIIMTATAVGIMLSTGFAGYAVMYAIGAVLFTASDIVLIFNTFSGVTKFPLRITNLSLYYLGQLLIGGSIFLLAL